ncbi:MAG: sulfotransferase [Thermodesulfobacteriota bacterium]
MKKLETPLLNKPTKCTNTKYFCIGYPKTGTNTLNYCFRLLGYRDIKTHDYFIGWFQNGHDISDIISDEIFCDYIECYDMFSDWPFHMIYKELDQKYPGSKFILTERRDQSTWQRSLAYHRKTRSKEELKKWSKKIPPYRKNHGEEVKEYFKNLHDDLLVVCWEKGDGWKELCDFLNVPIPDLPFPHMNKTRI